MVNLLPEKTREELRTLYYLRLITTWLVGMTVVVVSGAIALVPSYVLSEEEAGSGGRFKDAVEQLLSLKSSGSTDFATLSEETNILDAYSKKPFIARLLADVTLLKPKGVAVQKISFTESAGKGGEISVIGKAATREALVAYVTALQGDTRFSGVAVPVQNLASGSNLDFALSFVASLP